MYVYKYEVIFYVEFEIGFFIVLFFRVVVIWLWIWDFFYFWLRKGNGKMFIYELNSKENNVKIYW